MRLLLRSEITRWVLGKLARAAPGLALQALRAVFGWYVRLSFTAMFLVAALVGAAIVTALPSLLGNSVEVARLRNTIEAVLVLWLLLVILVGVVRPGGKG